MKDEFNLEMLDRKCWETEDDLNLQKELFKTELAAVVSVVTVWLVFRFLVRIISLFLNLQFFSITLRLRNFDIFVRRLKANLNFNEKLTVTASSNR